MQPPFVGMYVCGPTVYGDAHLGHARAYVTFDVLYRYLKTSGYKVRYVRNITDVGHLVNDADEGEDKIGKIAKLDQLEPMEVVQRFTNSFHQDMAKLNILSPDIEPRASGHIIEQIEMIQEIMKNGLAYEVNGSVYFDVPAYNKEQKYGKLSGRVIDELLSNTRDLEGQQEKRSPLDFALWKNASPEHIMRWSSPWGDGFPGWHLECSAMSRKYLGNLYDIHGGGLDLMFPHHECEIAQSQASDSHTDEARYWVHNNMITINGQKMGKSLGNFITLGELFSGNHDMVEMPYSPMTLRFFILQAHYRSTLDFSNEALQAARKGYVKLMNGLRLLDKLEVAYAEVAEAGEIAADVQKMVDSCYQSLADDMNTAKAISGLFNIVTFLNGKFREPIISAEVSRATFQFILENFRELVLEILGLMDEKPADADGLLEVVLDFYKKAKAEKDYAQVDAIRAALKKQNLVLKDSKTGVDWSYE